VKESRSKARIGVVEHRLFLAYLAALLILGLLTVHQIGISWDEPNYFTSSYSYLSWFGHVVAEPSDWWSSIDRYWEQSHEAPPFFKLWAGLFAGGAALVYGTEDLGTLGDAYRMGSYALFLLSTYAAFRFAREQFGSAAAWGAALSMPLIPALFGFARLGQLDGAVASMYLLAALALYRMLVRGGLGPTVLAGVVLGLAFATKLNVFPLVPAALLWVAVYRRERRTFARLFASFAIGAAVFFGIWPWLWRDPVGRTWEFLTWTAGLQEERFAYYLGDWWAGAPFHYPLVTLVVLVPLAVALAQPHPHPRCSRVWTGPHLRRPEAVPRRIPAVGDLRRRGSRVALLQAPRSSGCHARGLRGALAAGYSMDRDGLLARVLRRSRRPCARRSRFRVRDNLPRRHLQARRRMAR
jgi:4-amino-4-deoxy-L-arabinose transferase-like glycosyltransferase